MARLTARQKDHRVLKLLMGLSNPRILGPMVSRGFHHEDAEEGWRLLRDVGKLRFDMVTPAKLDPNLVSRLDEWENTWFPVADATLERHYPEVHKGIFLNLSQAEGPAVIVSVSTFLDRVTALRDGGEQNRQAAALLARRGLTDAVLADARALLVRIGKPERAPALPDLDAQRGETLAARAALWSWYLEWSRIARGVIADGNLLRELGFQSGSRGDKDDTDDE